MGRDASIRLSDFLQDRFGDRLRAVVHYGGDGYSIEYVRPDVAERITEEELSEIVTNHRAANFDRQSMEELVGEGRLNATVSLYENVLEIHFPHQRDAGTVATMQATAQEELYSFVGDCLTVIGNRDLE